MCSAAPYNVWQKGITALILIECCADKLQGRLLDLVVKALEAHVGNHGVSVKALRRHSQSLEATLFLILERDFQLRTAALPKAPPRPQSTSKRCGFFCRIVLHPLSA